jgi:hypothetical protein
MTLIAGIAIIYPSLNYIPFIAAGDHGRDFYAYEATMNGARPYIDYWWVYGPLMPYVYALFFKMIGVSMLSLTYAKGIILLVSGLLIFSSLTLATGPVIAFLTSLWFYIFQPDFFYTFNHWGGVLLSLMIMYFIFRYIFLSDKRSPYLALFFSFLLCFVKINIGFVVLILLLIAVKSIDITKGTKAGKPFYFLAFFLFLPLVLLTYSVFINGLPFYAIRQCFPYLDTDQPHNTSIFIALSNLAVRTVNDFSKIRPELFVNILFVLSILLSLKDLFIGKIKRNPDIYLALFTLGSAYVLFLHEYLKSGTMYRTFWASPFAFMFIFVMIHNGTIKFKKAHKTVLYIIILLVIIASWIPIRQKIKSQKTDMNYWAHPKVKVFFTNEKEWKETVTATTDYLQENLTEAETFFALPYDPLFYFLTSKNSPTRQLIFFNHINIPKEQEDLIIADLENKKIQLIVISNHAVADGAAMGIFGVTYCPLLSKYINENFKIVKKFGVWDRSSGWIKNYGTMILKRND